MESKVTGAAEADVEVDVVDGRTTEVGDTDVGRELEVTAGDVAVAGWWRGHTA